MSDSPTGSDALATLPGVREEAERLARESWEAMRATGAEINARGPAVRTRPMDAWEDTTPGVRAWWCETTLRLLCDLTRPASRDWWARWLAERVGLPVLSTSPTWEPTSLGWSESSAWLLAPARGDAHGDGLVFAEKGWEGPAHIRIVPGISALTDPAAALAAACLAVGGAS